jgi:hypothetical protein
VTGDENGYVGKGELLVRAATQANCFNHWLLSWEGTASRMIREPENLTDYFCAPIVYVELPGAHPWVIGNPLGPIERFGKLKLIITAGRPKAGPTSPVNGYTAP